MVPTYNDGDTILIKKSYFSDLFVDDIIAYKDNSRMVIHRIIKICGDYAFTKGDNADFVTKVYKKNILGKVYNE